MIGVWFCVVVGITSPPYRRTLWEWFEKMLPYLPVRCQQSIRRRSKTIQTGSSRLQHRTGPQQVRTSTNNEQRISMTTLNQMNTTSKSDQQNECITLLSK